MKVLLINIPEEKISDARQFGIERVYKYSEDVDFVLYKDTAILGKLSYPRAKRIAWLCEPNVVANHFIDNKNVAENFRAVLTYRNELLSRGEPYYYAAFGTSWVPPAEPPKTKLISFLASDKFNCEGHKLRYEILQDCLMRNVDVFGKIVGNYVDKKEVAHYPYKYTIVIENERHNGYFTEKLIDAFLSLTVPIYWGCPNLSKFFPENSFIPFNDPKELDIILDELKDYNVRLSALKEAKKIALDKYVDFKDVGRALSEL